MIDYHDRRVGSPDPRRPVAVRVSDPRGRAGGLELVDRAQQATEAYRRGLRPASTPEKVARYERSKGKAELLGDPGIIRNRLKVRVRDLQRPAISRGPGTVVRILRPTTSGRFVDGEPRINRWRQMSDIPPRPQVSTP